MPSTWRSRLRWYSNSANTPSRGGWRLGRKSPSSRNVLIGRGPARGPGATDDVGDGVLAQAQLAPDQAVAAPLGHEGEHPGRQAVGLGPLAGPPTEPLAPRLGGGEAGADPLPDELTLELGEAGEDGGHHPPVRGCEVEGQAVHRDHRRPAALALFERVQQVERAAA